MDADDGVRNPSTIFFQRDNVRRSIIASYWVVIILALPLWWTTTSIERLALPTSEVYAQANKELRIPVALTVDPAFIERDAHELKEEIQRAAPHLGVSVTIGSGHGDTSSYVVSPGGPDIVIRDRTLYYPQQNFTPQRLAQLVSTLLVPTLDQRAAQYAPRYRLSFTLLNEDASAGQAITSWDIEQAIHQHIFPITSALSVLHNFTIESQAQFHAPLAFEPEPILDGQAYGLTHEHLTVFINSAEWTLSSSSSNDPVLHFVVFIPSAARRPLMILKEDGSPSTSNAFLIPQWGGILIANLPPPPPKEMHLSPNDLRPIFSTFSRQLLTLLGVPRLPAGVSSSSGLLSAWQIDALLRQRTYENVLRTKDTLKSTVKLVDQIEGMPVDEQVRGDVQGALRALGELWALLKDGHCTESDLRKILGYSARALTLSKKAFFHPGMLALLYFPAEHKYAVYTPLFASAVIPLIAAAIREMLAWRRQRRGEAALRRGEEQQPARNARAD